jgi:hypothetical protein
LSIGSKISIKREEADDDTEKFACVCKYSCMLSAFIEANLLRSQFQST